MKKITWAIGIMAGALVCGCIARAGSSPDVLWHIVHEKCAVQANAGPCEETDTHAGYAVLKDRVGVGQYLLIPTQRVTGVEDPLVTRPDAPDYFAYAWRQTARVNGRLPHPLPPEDMSLAINSAYGRSQNQLHIHVDCIRPDIKVALHWASPRLGRDWTDLPLAGHAYRARLISVGDLSGARPFGLLAHDLADPAREMGQHTLVITAVRQPDGQTAFVMLDDRVDIAHGDLASGEELQDHECRIQHFP
ncbi:CDP-diacylglycerol diphosphatase [Komagataeibacter oboediens]|uniref:CDP-diacylglycerol diphosphatase n=1 Tax=Komagataeibacter oboediens TaxID=65958 RepID=UPI001999C0A5|nr:CDP-diacylglycerol diphosphatase [Komagataeibacter oboediens]MCK9819185.1 CDP-diacylglycerol diphosphatase [Komagataeibacter oboediens]GCE78882.1 CDP-diacylglycerol pyrophosphatase [Komagataeibacter oboediens]